ncbi:MAG: 30S ribosomal protein S2 [Patescibacteria group bacterium]
MSSKDTTQAMIEAGVHFGYSKRSAHPSMSPFVYGLKDGVSIFDLEKTQEQLEKAKAYLAEVSQSGKVIFCGSKNEARSIIKKNAEATHMPFVTTRWVGGTLTNWSEISKRVSKLVRMRDERERGEFEKYTKKERLEFDRDIAKLERNYGGLVGMKELPKALIVIDPKAEEVAVKEAQDKNIPIIAIASSDCDVTGIQYVIPANDNARASLNILMGELAKAITND